MYFFNDTSPTDIYTLSLHDALPIFLVVLAADHEVDVLVSGAHARIPLAGTKAAVEVQLLAERDVHAAKAGPDRGRDRALDGDAVGADRLQDVLGQRRAVAVHYVGDGLL